MEIHLPKHRCGRQNQLDLGQIARFSENIDITLHELAEPASLRTVSTPYISDLKRLKWRR